MILVIWRHAPDSESYAEWQDMLTTLALFELPLTVVLIGAAARTLTAPHCDSQAALLSRLAQLHELGVEPGRVLLHGESQAGTNPAIKPIDDVRLQQLCRQARHLVHC